MKIITLPNDFDPRIDSERQNIRPWAREHGWICVGYNDAYDHIAQIKRVSAGSTISIIDIVCHCTPTSFGYTPLSGVRGAFQWGKNLAQVPGFSKNTAIYLDGCNTGLRSPFGGPIAQAVANGAGSTVFGSRGYMKGTFAQSNERCYASPVGSFPYFGAQDAMNRDVWTAFNLRTTLLGNEDSSCAKASALLM